MAPAALLGVVQASEHVHRRPQFCTCPYIRRHGRREEHAFPTGNAHHAVFARDRAPGTGEHPALYLQQAALEADAQRSAARVLRCLRSIERAVQCLLVPPRLMRHTALHGHRFYIHVFAVDAAQHRSSSRDLERVRRADGNSSAPATV